MEISHVDLIQHIKALYTLEPDHVMKDSCGHVLFVTLSLDQSYF